MRTALKKDEIILLITRQHRIKLVLPVIVWLLVAIISIALLHVTGFIITLVTAAYPLFEYLNWKNNLWCITNIRVVDESGFFSRYAKESPLDKINNVEYDQSIWGRLFGFGNVDIQTASELGETTYELIDDPQLLKDTITQAQQEYKASAFSNQAAQFALAINKKDNGDNTNPQTPAIIPPQLVADELLKLFELLQKGAITEAEYSRQKTKLLG